MGQTALDWDGMSWEEHCINLLRLRYRVPGQFERVPSGDQGDLGIEGFSHDGCAYQCYAPEGPLPIKDRYERQRDKLTEDLAKLEKNQRDFVRILGGVVIKTYVFMTPIHDSRRLNGHAKTKAEEVRAKSLPHCHPRFDVVIHTEDDYPVERAELISLGLKKWHLAPISVPDIAVQTFVDSNQSFVKTMDEKLSRIPNLSADQRSTLRSQLLRWKLIADNKLDERALHLSAVLMPARQKDPGQPALRQGRSSCGPARLSHRTRLSAGGTGRVRRLGCTPATSERYVRGVA